MYLLLLYLCAFYGPLLGGGRALAAGTPTSYDIGANMTCIKKGEEDCVTRFPSVSNDGDEGPVKVGGTPLGNPYNPGACPPKKNNSKIAAYTSLGYDPGNPANALKYGVTKIKPIDGWPGEFHLEIDDKLRAWRDSVLVKANKAHAKTTEADNSDIPGYDLGRIAQQLDHECEMHKAMGESCPLKNNYPILKLLKAKPTFWFIETGNENAGMQHIEEAKSSGIPGENIYLVHYGPVDPQVCNSIPGSHVVFSSTRDLKAATQSVCPEAPKAGSPSAPPPQPDGNTCAQNDPPPEKEEEKNPPPGAPVTDKAPSPGSTVTSSAKPESIPADSQPWPPQRKAASVEKGEDPPPDSTITDRDVVPLYPRGVTRPSSTAYIPESYGIGPAGEEHVGASPAEQRPLRDLVGENARYPGDRIAPIGAGGLAEGVAEEGMSPSSMAASRARKGGAAAAKGGDAAFTGVASVAVTDPKTGKAVAVGGSGGGGAGADGGGEGMGKGGAGNAAAAAAKSEALSAFVKKDLGAPVLSSSGDENEATAKSFENEFVKSAEAVAVAGSVPVAEAERTLFSRVHDAMIRYKRGGRLVTH